MNNDNNDNNDKIDFYNANINKIIKTKMNWIIKQYYINILRNKYYDENIKYSI